MIDQTFYDEGTLTRAYDAIGMGQSAVAVEIVSKLLGAGLLIRERTPDSAIPNEPGPAGPYPMSASLDEQRRAFALSHSHGPLEAERIEQYLMGPTGDAQSEPVTSDEASTPEAKNPYSITENPYAHQVWNRGYKEANTPLKKLSDIDRDPAVAPFLPPRDYEDQLSYDRGYEQGRRFADAAIYVNGWNAALEELRDYRLSLEVLRTDVNVGTPRRVSVRDLITGMRRL